MCLDFLFFRKLQRSQVQRLVNRNLFHKIVRVGDEDDRAGGLFLSHVPCAIPSLRVRYNGLVTQYHFCCKPII